MSQNTQNTLSRLENSLFINFGDQIRDALADNAVLEIMLNPDRSLWTERFGQPMQCVERDFPAEQALNICNLLATHAHVTVTEQRPSLQAVLPPAFHGARFQAFVPPVTAHASFCIRKRPTKIFSLQDYVEAGILTDECRQILGNSLTLKRNILVSGGTGSGKTTFVNALIHELAELCPDARLNIAEDTPELQSASPNTVCLLSTDHISLNEIIKGCLRFRPDRILVGEVRDGSALQLLKAWNTGHPGGIGTLHADSAEETLPRLEELVAEATPAPKQALIGRAVDRIVSIEKRPEGRRITEILDVTGWNASRQEYDTLPLWSYAS